MAVIIEKRTNLDMPIRIDGLHGVAFTNETDGHQFVIRCEQKGQDLTLVGTVSAKFIRADGNTIQLVGSIVDGAAVVTLAQDCYNVQGRFQLAIFNTVGNAKLCIYACVGTVQKAQSGNLIDGGSIIPDVEDLIADIQEARQSIPPTYDTLLASIAGTYDSTKTYTVGDYAWYDGQLKKCIVPITTAESWTAAHWANAVIGDDVSGLKSAIADENLTGLSLDFDGKYLKSDNTESDNGMLSHTDYIRIPANAIRVLLGNKTSGITSSLSYTISPNVLFYDENKVFLSYVNVSGQEIADVQIPSNAVFLRANQPSSTAVNADRLIRFVYVNVENLSDTITGFVGGGTFTFTSARQIIQTTIPVEENKNYAIICETNINDLVNIYAHANSNVYSRIYNAGTFYFRSNNNSTIDLYNIRGYIGDIKISVYEADKLVSVSRRTPVVYHVGTNQAFTSFTACCFALKNDDSEKIIEIDGGDYDIFSEYMALGLLDEDAPLNPETQYFDKCVMIPSNTHVIGKGIVRLIWQPTTSQISTGWSKTISPVNCAGTMTLENVEIYCKNGRYCIHDDTLGKNEYFGAVKKYVNVKCFKQENDTGYGFNSVIGFGLDARCLYYFDGCYFNGPNGNVFYMHSRSADELGNVFGVTFSPTVIAKNCIMDANSKTKIAIKLGNVANAPWNIRTIFENCSVLGWLQLRDEDASTGNNTNAFNVTLLNCSKMQISDLYGDNNPYPVKELNPNDYTTLSAEIAKKANSDGYYQDMTVGDAEQLVSTVGIEDKVPYNFRTAGGSAGIGDRLTEKIVGGTIAWNQQLKNGNFAEGNKNWTGSSSTLTITDGAARSTITGGAWNNDMRQNTAIVIDGHIYLIKALVRQSSTNFSITFRNPGGQSALNFFRGTEWTEYASFIKVTSATPNGFALTVRENGTDLTDEWFEAQNINCFDLTQMFGSTIAEYIYSLEQANAGAGVAWFRNLFPKSYYAYNAGELMHVQASAHNMVGFNAWDGETESGYVYNGIYYQNNDYWRTKNFIPVVGGASYYFKVATGGQINCYDAEKTYITSIADFGGSSHIATMPSNCAYIKFYQGVAADKNTVCVNLSWDGERDGEYEPYELHSYPLDSDLVLRGIPKLDSNNELYYDGDEYLPDGTVNRRYGIVTLDGSNDENWSFNTWNESLNIYRAYINVPDIDTSVGSTIATNMICNNFPTDKYNHVAGKANFVTGRNNLAQINFFVDTVTTASEWKTWLSNHPTIVVYELAESTTETADPFQSPQIVNDFGTEEYVDAGVTAETRDVAIPVGHVTQYQNNLRAKLEMAPDSPDGDGDYVVRQTNGKNSYVPLVIPTELPARPSSDGTYRLKATVSDGITTLTWEEVTE